MSAEKKLIEGCKARNRKAQKSLFEKYKSMVMGICMRYCKSRDEAEDVLMEVFLSVFTEIDAYRSEGPVEQWIRRIAINTSINNYRRNLKHYFHSDIDDVDERRIDKDDYNETAEQFSASDIVKLVQELPEGYRMIFNLYAVEGYKHKEIAEMLGINEGTSKSQLSKARKMLQGKLNIQ